MRFVSNVVAITINIVFERVFFINIHFDFRFDLNQTNRRNKLLVTVYWHQIIVLIDFRKYIRTIT